MQNKFYQDFLNADPYLENHYRANSLRKELVIQQAIKETSLKLLFEIIFLNALLRYYERLYYQSQLDQYYPEQYYPEQYYPEQYPNYYQWRSQSFNHHYPQSIPQRPIQKQFGNKDLKHRRTHLFSKLHLGNSFSHNLVDIAKHNIGRPVWAFSKFASLCQSGYLGCAATVSELLQKAGVKIKDTASVSTVVNELTNLDWHKVKITNKDQFHAGDIVYGLKGHHAHIGIITQANKDKVLVCDNSSATGTLKERTIESGGSFTPNGRFAGSLYVMRPRDS